MTRKESVEFFSEGVEVRGEMYLPEEHQPGEKRAAWVINSGIVGPYVFRGHCQAWCIHLARHGYVALVFDHRGMGISDGERATANPWMRARDVQNGITYLQTRPEVDERRIGIGGYSLGGTVAPYVAGIDERAAAMVSVYGIGNGRRWLRTMRNAGKWHEFLREVEENRKQRVLTGKGKLVDSHFAMGSQEQPVNEAWIARGLYGGDIMLSGIEAILDFYPEDVVHRIAPRPVLYVHSPLDRVVDVQEAISMYEKSGEPKTLWLLPAEYLSGSSHYQTFPKEHPDDELDPDRPGLWSVLIGGIIEWTLAHLPNDPLPPGAPYERPELRAGYATRALGRGWLRPG